MQLMIFILAWILGSTAYAATSRDDDDALSGSIILAIVLAFVYIFINF